MTGYHLRAIALHPKDIRPLALYVDLPHVHTQGRRAGADGGGGNPVPAVLVSARTLVADPPGKEGLSDCVVDLMRACVREALHLM